MQKTALITGATSGFGKAIAERLAKENFQLILTGRRQERLKQLKEELSKLTQVHILCFDVQDRNATIDAIRSIPESFKPINLLVNNAGLASGLSTLENGSYSDWDSMIDTNVKGLLNVSKEALPLLADGAAQIINISSIAGKMVYPNGNVYCATKHAVDALTQAMRIELLPRRIKVCSINPGAAETEFSIVRFKGDEERAKKVYDGFTPLQANDIADVVFYLSSLPPHVCINDLTITCITQANSHYSIKDEV